MALEFKKLTIIPQGNISGGYLQYSMDPLAGNISYQGEVTAKAWFFSKTVPLVGISKVDPAILQSANVKVGQVFDFGQLKVMIKEVSGGIAVADVVLKGDITGAGQAKFDLRQPVIALVEIVLTSNLPVIGNQTLRAKA